MKIKIAAFIAGILGVLGVLLFLIAFGTDYWLLATETCGGFEPENNTLHTKEGGKEEQKSDSREVLTFHHEGFFWRCWFYGDYKESIWTFWFTSQGHPKYCMNGYLFPMPIALGPYPHPSYDATAVYRGFWTAFIVLAVTSSLVGGFLLVCGVPFVNARFYKVGGGFLLTAGILFALLIFLFVMWKEFAADLAKYILLERSDRCEDEIPVKVYYGWSFIFAAAGVPLVLLSGLLFYLVGYSILKELE
ncbi:transmembrane protein 182-like [Sphaerodactylus townsendi]|uniref:transmembrane protein 182-like n=1 Tax=Sphaerodactylus townsendi TaxID=933632 RepID=UPI0020267B53|nr:transmembrane protein 182-like [Sphaerodactylus townsendi]